MLGCCGYIYASKLNSARACFVVLRSAGTVWTPSYRQVLLSSRGEVENSPCFVLCPSLCPRNAWERPHLLGQNCANDCWIMNRIYAMKFLRALFSLVVYMFLRLCPKIKSIFSGRKVLLRIRTPFQNSPFTVAFSSLYGVHGEQIAVCSHCEEHCTYYSP